MKLQKMKQLPTSTWAFAHTSELCYLSVGRAVVEQFPPQPYYSFSEQFKGCWDKERAIVCVYGGKKRRHRRLKNSPIARQPRKGWSIKAVVSRQPG